MSKILIFRTDRIGDLLTTCPAIISLKNSIKNSSITVVTSKKNDSYAKTFSFIDETILFPNNIFDKIKFILKLSKFKFDFIFIFDGKDRSIISSIFLNSHAKIFLFPTNKFYLFFLKIFKVKFVKDDDKTNLIELYQKMFSLAKIDKKITNFDFIKIKVDNKTSSKININNYIHLHLNEKWFNELYINKYTDINPSYKNFVNFILELAKRENLLISTGLIDFNLLNELKSNFFLDSNLNIFKKKVGDKIIYLVDKPTLLDLESLLKKSKIFINCHSGIIHLANSYNIKILDIIDKKRSAWYIRFTGYLSNYNLIYRSSFEILSKKILDFYDKNYN
jgi:ADP-heptose:LPS heptosyltransferase